jgi:hypothetical protein
VVFRPSMLTLDIVLSMSGSAISAVMSVLSDASEGSSVLDSLVLSAIAGWLSVDCQTQPRSIEDR